jgi:hypothetical protein
MTDYAKIEEEIIFCIFGIIMFCFLLLYIKELLKKLGSG